MKFALFSFFLILGVEVYAFECVQYDRSSQPVSTHAELATDIFWGQVVSGQYDQVSGLAKFTVDVQGVLKGDPRHTAELETLSMSYGIDVSLGESNIYFLYNGSNSINACAMVMYIGGGIDSIADLVSESKRADLAGAYKIEQLLKHLGKLP